MCLLSIVLVFGLLCRFRISGLLCVWVCISCSGLDVLLRLNDECSVG